MINPDYLEDDVLNDILANMDTEDEQKVRHHSVNEAFDRFLNWNGIIGYTDKFEHAYHSLLVAEHPEFKDTGESLVFEGETHEMAFLQQLVDEVEPDTVLIITRLSTGNIFVREMGNGNR